MLSIQELHSCMRANLLAEESPDEALLRDYVTLVDGLLKETDRLRQYLEFLSAPARLPSKRKDR